MNNPFRGMNPYLQQPELWHQAHNRLIVAVADEITLQVVPFISCCDRRTSL